MDTCFVEATNGFNHGKFMVGRLTAEEAQATSNLPGLEGEWLFHNSGGRRRFTPDRTLIVDLQTGEGCEFSLERHGLPHAEQASWELNDRHKIWVCPLFEPFVRWLAVWASEHENWTIGQIPNLIDLKDAKFAFAGHRREGSDV
jgi:hypothetical protein